MTDLSFSNPTALLAAVFMLLSDGRGREDNMRKADHSAREASIQDEHRSARQRCRLLSGSAQAVCVEQADADRQVARAELTWSWTGRAEDHRHWQRTRVEAQYDVAVARCGTPLTPERSLCTQEAAALRLKALSQLAPAAPP